MNDFFAWALPLAEGALLGLSFFAGLWWTVRRGITSGRVVLWFLGSMLLRVGMVVLGFYFLLGDDWKKLIVGLMGFIIARLVVTRWTKILDASRLLAQESHRAS